MKMSRGASLGLLVVTCLVITTAFAEDRDRDRDGGYLALGDSVAFGYINDAGFEFEYVNPDNFVGYPEYAGRMLRLDAVNAACPGETTGSFISSSAPDLGCRDFRSQAPLHVSYALTQLDFATKYLKMHRETKLVTIDLGANDVFLCLAQAACSQSASALSDVVARIELNMAEILGDLRATGFNGVIVVVNYYSLDYSDNSTQKVLASDINTALASAAATYGAVIADVYSAFQNVSSAFANQTCMAGLLNPRPQSATAENNFPCDIHPSQSGAKLIGKTIAAAYAAAKGDDRD